MLKSRVIYCPFILVCHWIESEPAPVLFFSWTGPLSQLTNTSKVITWKQSQVEKPVHWLHQRETSWCRWCMRWMANVGFIKEDTILTIFTSSCPKVLSESGPCMVVSSSPPLLLAGDYFTSSSFSGCFQRHICSWNMDGITVDLCWSIVY